MIYTAIVLGPTWLAIFYPYVGTLASVLGAIGGCLVIYIVPTVTYLKQSHTAIANPDLVAALRNNSYKITEDDAFVSSP